MRLLIFPLLACCILSCKQEPNSREQTITEESSSILENFPSIDKSPAHQVLVLGVFHFDRASDGSDVVAENHLDIMNPENQKELDSILQKLRTYNPTRIAVEWKLPYQGYLDSLYLSYRSNNYTPGKNEIFQLGFKLAGALGHTTLYCIDNNPPLPESVNAVDDWDEYARELGHTDIWHKYDMENQRYLNYMDTIQNNTGLIDYLKIINSPENILRSKQLWTTGLINLGHGDQYLGADLLGRWYRRNARIYSNAKNLALDPTERILIIYGGAHKWILDELFESSPDFEVLQFNTLLSGN